MNHEPTILEIRERFRLGGRDLNELDRRRWAASEALRLGRGGITLVSKALRMSRNTIRRGIREIETGHENSPAEVSLRIRKPGGGRKSRRTV